jgi:pimeloyl-ACP methyl ester carboxylesterase
MNRTKRSSWVLISGALVTSGCFAYTPAISGPDGRPLPGSVAALEKLEIGGMDQWILIRGADSAKPVLLRLHGGPGSADMPITRHFNGALEEHFVVVSWDQRGAGKSNRRGFDEASMTFERFVEDAHELTVYLKERFQQERIYLMGHSWGTQLGIHLAAKYPEHYWAYIAVSQLVGLTRSTEIAYAWLTERIEGEGNSRELRRLEALGPPPYREHQAYVRFAKMVDAHGGNMDVGMGRLAWLAARAPEYTLPDLVRWLRGANRGSGQMWDTPDYSGYNAFQDVPRLEVPVYFFTGSYDQNTPLELIREYVEVLESPAGKELVVFEHSAHTPFLAEPERFCQELVRVKRETRGNGRYSGWYGGGARRELAWPRQLPAGTPGNPHRARPAAGATALNGGVPCEPGYPSR